MLYLINTLLLQLACNEITDPSDTDNLNGELFELQETEGDTLIESLGIYFDADGEYLRFGGVCNDHSGGFEIIDGALHFTLEASTEMACPIEDSAEEGELIAFMESTPQLDFDGETLTLGGQSTTLTLDKYVPTPAVPLVGIDWIIRSYYQDADVGDGGPSSTGYGNSPTNATIRFDEDGTFAIDTGCNVASGTYILEEYQLTIDLTVESDLQCTGDELSREEHIFYVMRNSPTYFIESYELRVEGSGKGFRAYTQ